MLDKQGNVTQDIMHALKFATYEQADTYMTNHEVNSAFKITDRGDLLAEALEKTTAELEAENKRMAERIRQQMWS